jgi:cysteine-rich repeat protein
MYNISTRTLLSLLSGTLLALGACSSDGPSTNPECRSGDKCDDPGTTADRECREMCGGDSACVSTCRDGRALQHCEARRSDALDSAQVAFTKDNIRWACADVEGVNTNRRDDRGQEYCEYYAAIQLPPETEGGALPTLVTTGRADSNDSLSLDLKEDQIFALEDEPDAIVGQCVFTSWHSDINESLPVCNGNEAGCPKLALAEDTVLPSWYSRNELDLGVNRELMKMKGSINSNVAASDLFEKCMTGPLVADDTSDASDPLNDDYIRGCMHTYELFKTEWRRSDPSICAAGGRLAECGCGVDTDGDGVADITDPREISVAVVPRQPDQDGTLRLRGFHLGTWSDMNALPSGCRYIETGDADSTSTLVACDLTASDVLSSANDPKQRCRDKYGDNVVIHVPVPAAAIVCAPPADGPYTESCGELPWVLGNEGTAPVRGGVCGDGDLDTTAGEGCDDGNTDDGDGCSSTCVVEAPVVCEFDPCVDGSTPPDSCDADACVVAVCAADSFCCETAWDNLCIGAVDSACSTTCNESSF